MGRYVKRLRPGSYAAGLEGRRRTEPIHNGCDRKVYAAYLQSLGWQHTRIQRAPLSPGRGTSAGAPDCGGNGHVVAVIDGVIRDTYDSGGAGKRQVEGYWSLTPPNFRNSK